MFLEWPDRDANSRPKAWNEDNFTTNLSRRTHTQIYTEKHTQTYTHAHTHTYTFTFFNGNMVRNPFTDCPATCQNVDNYTAWHISITRSTFKRGWIRTEWYILQPLWYIVNMITSCLIEAWKNINNLKFTFVTMNLKLY